MISLQLRLFSTFEAGSYSFANASRSPSSARASQYIAAASSSMFAKSTSRRPRPKVRPTGGEPRDTAGLVGLHQGPQAAPAGPLSFHCRTASISWPTSGAVWIRSRNPRSASASTSREVPT